MLSVPQLVKLLSLTKPKNWISLRIKHHIITAAAALKYIYLLIILFVMLDMAKTQFPCLNRVLIKTRGGRVLNKYLNHDMGEQQGCEWFEDANGLQITCCQEKQY